jgi:hypothetical protein
VPERILVFGETRGLDRAKKLFSDRLPLVPFEAVDKTWEFNARAREEQFSVALLLPASIAEHEMRVEAVATLRRDGFAGRVLFAGSFLTEKKDALEAGADYVFDPQRQAVDTVVANALFRPTVAVDHPYLAYLLIEEWAKVQPYSGAPTAEAAIVLAATSSHKDPAFWERLADLAAADPGKTCIVVEDDDDAENNAAAMACGVQPYVALADKGLLGLHAMVRRVLREIWLARMMKI